MSDIEHLIVVVIIILISGVLGGTVNYFRESTPLSENHSYLKKLFPGIAASFVVPLFLNMISSSLLIDSRTNLLSLLVFSGFCVIASVYSRDFMETVSKKILDKVEQLESDQKEMKAEVEPIVAKETEPVFSDNDESFREQSANGLTENERKILFALSSSEYSLRSIVGLAKSSGISEAAVVRTLDTLVDKGHVESKRGLSKNRLYWGLTIKGYMLAHLIKERDKLPI